MKRIDLTGQVFDRLTPVEYVGKRRWLCECECGNTTIVHSHKLQTSHTRSCGCLHKEFLDVWKRNKTHGETNTYLHRCWGAMKHRCRNENNSHYHDYGGRGITYSPLFETYEAFASYIRDVLGERPEGMSLDRIDNNGKYEPGNLRWATQSEQNANRRRYAA